MSKHYIIPIFVPHLGCPHDCVFCNQRKIASSITDITPEDVRNTIEEYLGYFRQNSFIEVAFYGGSFTAIDMDIQSSLLKIPYEYKKRGIIHEIRLSTRPDAIDETILNNLNRYDVDTIELGVQSMDKEVLDASGRGHTVEDVFKAVDLIKRFGFKLGLQMMIGLPKDNLNRDVKTAMEFIDLKPDCVRIYPTLVIRDTYLEKELYAGRYMALKIDEAINISTILLMLFYLNKINVIRVGLQVTENIQLGKDVIDGPFHPAFRQLVESNVYREILTSYFSKMGVDTEGKILKITANKKAISSISGQKSSNIEYLIRRYGFKKVKIYEDDIDLTHICVEIDELYDKIDLDLYMRSYLSDYIW